MHNALGSLAVFLAFICVSGLSSARLLSTTEKFSGELIVMRTDGAQVCKTSEHDVMLALFASLGGPSWTAATDWAESPGHCGWSGVECSVDGHVTAIQLNGVGATGTIPAEVGCLVFLQSLALGGNAIAGSIPVEMGGLQNLKYLHLHHNHLRGPVPATLCGLRHLQYLSLDHNLFEGPLPPCLGILYHLRLLHVQCNNMTGTLPPALAGLPLLTDIDVSCNHWTDPCPADLADAVGSGLVCEASCYRCPVLHPIDEGGPSQPLDPIPEEGWDTPEQDPSDCPRYLTLQNCGVFRLLDNATEPLTVDPIPERWGDDHVMTAGLRYWCDLCADDIVAGTHFSWATSNVLWTATPVEGVLTVSYDRDSDTQSTRLQSDQLGADAVVDYYGFGAYHNSSSADCRLDQYSGVRLCIRTQTANMQPTHMSINGEIVTHMPSIATYLAATPDLLESCFTIDTPGMDWSLDWTAVIILDLMAADLPPTDDMPFLMLFGSCPSL